MANIYIDTPALLGKSVQNTPLVTASSLTVCDTPLSAIAFALRPVTGNIFNRYPLYAFDSDGGIYAVATDTTSSSMPVRKLSAFAGTVTSSRLICAVPEGIAFVSLYGDTARLTLLNGYTLTTVLERLPFTPSHMLYNDAYGELLLADSTSAQCIAVNIPQCTFYRRAEPVGELLAPRYALSLSDEESPHVLYDVTRETLGNTADVLFRYLSVPISVSTDENPTLLILRVISDRIDMSSVIYKSYSAYPRGSRLRAVGIRGAVSAPIEIPLLRPTPRLAPNSVKTPSAAVLSAHRGGVAMRSMWLLLSGRATPGTLLRSFLIE